MGLESRQPECRQAREAPRRLGLARAAAALEQAQLRGHEACTTTDADASMVGLRAAISARFPRLGQVDLHELPIHCDMTLAKRLPSIFLSCLYKC